MVVTAQDLDQEVTFLSGVLDTGAVASTAYYTWNATDVSATTYSQSTSHANKWGGGSVGTSGSPVSYAFDAGSSWTDAERSSFLGAMGLWSSVSGIRFQAVDQASAKLVFVRDLSARGADTTHFSYPVAIGATSLPDAVQGSADMHMTINTSVTGFKDLDSFQIVGGYGVGTIVHEMGHVLGLGHAGPYSAYVKGGPTAVEKQFGAFDSKQWTVMSYVDSDNANSPFHADDPYPTKWGLTADRYDYSAFTPGMVDILAAQRLYGAPTDSALSGNQVFGFNTTITGALKPYFDFAPSADGTTNSNAIVTLFSTGKNNTLDLSGFATASTVDLRPGTFSSANGKVNNIGIALDTVIDRVVGGAGDDTFTLNGDGDTVDGGGGKNTVIMGHQLAAYGHAQHGETLLLHMRNATDRLTDIQTVRFTDGTLTLGDDPLIDNVYYAQHNTDVFRAGVTANSHYAQSGWHEGRNPNSLFTTTAYLHANPDVATSGINPLAHYDQFGWHEGRDPSVGFSSSLYLLRNPDVAAVGMDPLAHYFEFGYMEGRHAVPVVNSFRLQGGFDPGFYLLANPDVASSGLDPLTHWRNWGEAEGRDPDSFFSTADYLSTNPDVAAAGLNPLDHYLQVGWAEGRNPSTHFNTDAYLAHNPDVAAAAAAGQINPLIHFLQFGIAEGRSGYGDSI